ncbi:MAG: hypothetical protein RLZZ127_1322 [Planctomycetota bacterium]|jgi:hypothetical protein
MKVAVYVTTDAVPATSRVVGFVVDADGLLPVRFTGSSVEAVRRAGEEWIADQRQRAAVPERPKRQQPAHLAKQEAAAA